MYTIGEKVSHINSSQSTDPTNNTLDQLNMIVDNIPPDTDCSNSDTSSNTL